MNQFYEKQGIKREFSVARTPEQNRVAKRKNRIVIEAARTMLADSKLPTTFWAEVVNTDCYVQNKVLVIKPHNKTLYELFYGRTPSLSFMRAFGCPVTIFNTLDPLCKFDGKADEGFFVGYLVNSKAFRVFNSRTRIVEETLHITLLENKPNVVGSGPTWLFDNLRIISQLLQGISLLVVQDSPGDGFKPLGEEEKKDAEDPGNEDNEFLSVEEPRVNQEKDANVNNTNNINTISPTANAASIKDNVVDENIVYGCTDDPNMPNLEEIIYSDDEEDVGVDADMTNLDINIHDLPCDLEAYTDNDYAGSSLDRDSYEKRLIQVIKIHTDHNVADLLTKAFDVSRFHYLISTAKVGIEVNTGNSSVIATGHYLMLLGIT
uniref:Ribonuclease H-like domain-containing protein n=1 Tax=Tanacetum cinerariifolium TaxID=118510 RepID=A0A6L2LNI7_TANCI|nr:ribonuclease H-like domain-containing protein [Tanacetum cinerariifolium]